MTHGAANLSATTILVVEDEAAVQQFMLVEVLEEAGYNVIWSEDATQAIEALETRHDIGLLLTDTDLYFAAEGFVLARLVRNRWPNVQIILTSGNMTYLQEALSLGEQFMPKPFKTEFLLDCVKKGLR